MTHLNNSAWIKTFQTKRIVEFKRVSSCGKYQTRVEIEELPLPQLVQRFLGARSVFDNQVGSMIKECITKGIHDALDLLLSDPRSKTLSIQQLKSLALHACYYKNKRVFEFVLKQRKFDVNEAKLANHCTGDFLVMVVKHRTFDYDYASKKKRTVRQVDLARISKNERMFYWYLGHDQNPNSQYIQYKSEEEYINLMDIIVFERKFSQFPRTHIPKEESDWYSRTLKKYSQQISASLAACILLIQEGYYTIKQDTNKCPKNPKKFFRIVPQLPLELIMIVILRFNGSSKDFIKGEMMNSAMKREIYRIGPKE